MRSRFLLLGCVFAVITADMACAADLPRDYRYHHDREMETVTPSRLLPPCVQQYGPILLRCEPRSDLALQDTIAVRNQLSGSPLRFRKPYEELFSWTRW